MFSHGMAMLNTYRQIQVIAYSLYQTIIIYLQICMYKNISYRANRPTIVYSRHKSNKKGMNDTPFLSRSSAL